MESVDQQFRLAKEHYAGMTDGEIGALADDAYNLTEVGREALAAVISERGMGLQLKTGPPAPSQVRGPCDTPDIEDSELVSYGWAMDAEGLKRLKGWLTWVGTACFIGPDNVLEPEDHKGSFANGVNVKIRSVDRQHTLFTLQKIGGPAWPSPIVTLKNTAEEPDNEEEPDNNEGQSVEIRCPQCNSVEVIFEGRDCKDSTNPPPTAKYNWSCCACGNLWQNDGVLAADKPLKIVSMDKSGNHPGQ
jgi:DNA-directed RNA polymerase subunit M/transcription elongation factor TFIIS